MFWFLRIEIKVYGLRSKVYGRFKETLHRIPYTASSSPDSSLIIPYYQIDISKLTLMKLKKKLLIDLEDVYTDPVILKKTKGPG